VAVELDELNVRVVGAAVVAIYRYKAYGQPVNVCSHPSQQAADENGAEVEV
jgi:hypothetical protein